VVLSYEQIAGKNYSFSAGQYFDVKIEYTDITAEEFEAKMEGFKANLGNLFVESKSLEDRIRGALEGLQYK
jgi:type I restriction enzyme M protein